MKIEFDTAFSFGLGVFETIKVVNGKAFFLEKHLKRLQKGLDFLAIKQPINLDNIYSALEEGQNIALKIIVSEKNQVITKRSDPYSGIDRKKGKKLIFSSVLRNSTSPFTYHKTLQYGDNILEKHKATEQGYDEVLFLNEKGYICEGAVTNIFFLKGKKIYTPAQNVGLLAGTMREYLMEQYPIQECIITKEQLKGFDACFISNALMGILWVEQLENFHFVQSQTIKELIEHIENLGF